MQSMINALSWTLLHSIWQGLLAALVAAVIISSTRRSRARIRYNSLGLVLILFLVSSLLTFQYELTGYQDLPTGTSALTGTRLDNNNPIGTFVTARSNWSLELTDWVDQHTNLLVLAWVVFFCINCIKLFAGMATVGRLRQYKILAVPLDWENRLSILLGKMGIPQSVKLLQSGLVNVPVVLGVLKPVILVPIGLLSNIPPEQAESILLHELAHIRRKDYLVNLLQRFVDAIFFFNPSLLWISSLIRQEREACCDDLVVSTTGQKRDYVNALVTFQEYSLHRTTCAMAIGSKRQFLLNRVRRMLTNENKGLNLFEKFTILSGLILFSAFSTFEKKAEDKAFTIPIARYQPIIPRPVYEMDEARSINLPTTNKKMFEKMLLQKPIADTVLPRIDSIVKKIKDRQVPTMNPLPPSLDTIPASGTKKEPVVTTDKEPGKEVDESKKILNEILKIKEKIGGMKDDIGVDKDKLKDRDKMDKKEVEEIEARIMRKRKAVDVVREELEEKREELRKYESQKRRQLS